MKRTDQPTGQYEINPNPNTKCVLIYYAINAGLFFSLEPPKDCHRGGLVRLSTVSLISKYLLALKRRSSCRSSPFSLQEERLWKVISAKIRHLLQTRRNPLQTFNQYELDGACEIIPVNFTLQSCANRTMRGTVNGEFHRSNWAA